MWGSRRLAGDGEQRRADAACPLVRLRRMPAAAVRVRESGREREGLGQERGGHGAEVLVGWSVSQKRVDMYPAHVSNYSRFYFFLIHHGHASTPCRSRICIDT